MKNRPVITREKMASIAETNKDYIVYLGSLHQELTLSGIRASVEATAGSDQEYLAHLDNVFNALIVFQKETLKRAGRPNLTVV